ncbi:RNA exonuclease 1 homolog isoform X1 [Thunnus maccoyii]|uniref:RNA exonuclease 1 homolog isoform X1 n=1 Tax=Thunnus maccoyii TaxID=8240 RepID=UPI001C4C8952|nr:RNA exonuclease 1 homolog isoform X1 [Thunnus maccoyii]
MLRSTGFFRGIDCPFYTEYSESKGSRNGCNRPYCHFRHSQQRRLSYGAAADVKKLHSAQKEQGYDPFNPEVVRPQEQQNGKPAASGDLSGALELVNKAIEEVRSEVEREKRKLSRIGDEPYEPSGSTGLSSSDAGKGQAAAAASSHSAYDPGSYQMTSGGYNPTPGCSKYTLDSDNQGSNSNSMEYVPTSLKKPPSRTHTHQLPSPPPSPKYSNSTSSSKCKYTVDNSKPSTDMEYDPLSNYSAGIAGKSKRSESAHAVKGEGSKAHRLPVSDLSDEEYVIAVKKPQQQSVDTKKYTFSDSDGESSGTEYRPTSLSNLQQRKNNSGSAGDAAGKDRKERTKSMLNALTQRNKDDLAQDSDIQEDIQLKNNMEKKKVASRTSQEKSGKSEKVHKLEKELNKTSNSKSSSSSSSKDKGSLKNSSQDSAKKENKSHGKRDDRKSTVKVKTSDKVHREDKRSEDKIKAVEKVKTDSSKRDKDTENSAKESKKPKILDKEKEHSKYKDRQHKNGKLDSNKREKDVKKLKSSSSSGSSNSKGSSANSKEKLKQSISSSNGKKPEQKRRTLSLSHADLFGDESPEEAEPMEVDDDDEEAEEVLVRKSADALKRGRLNKRKASELTPSSSEDEGDHVVEGGRADKDEVDGVGMDFSSFQDDLDFDSDPMEECLRIFNESKDVKREDKGRQAKQPSRDSDEEKGTESTLTTLFPGQKKRVSHFVAKGNTDAPSKSVVRPYKRPSAQEVCYQRMQMAQQQAAQLSASVKAASQISSPSSSGERKRIAHRPNPLMSSSKTIGSADAKPASSRVLTPSQTHQSVKAQTTAGILSKTMSTATQKRVAHTPTMKSTSMKRPVIPIEFGAKVPNNIRQRYLNAFIDECVKFCPSEDIAFQMGLDEEKLVYDRSNSKNIYLNVAVNTLKKLRSKSTSCPSPVTKEPGSATSRRVQSHEEVLGGRLAATTSFTVNRMGKQQEEKLIGAALYRKLKPYLMTDEQLQEHGYPRTNPEAPGKAIMYNLPEKKAIADPFTKICCRCGAEYKINVNGDCVRKEECGFHWGRLRRHKVAGGWETIYSCCSGAVGSPGCQVAKQHVQDGRKETFDGYVTTFSKSLPPDGNGGVFALDCEMCYTKQGLELTRVTVIDSDLKVIYDTFVKPESKVVDYNTRFSGVTAEDLESSTITLRDVQAVLLSMFSAESILIGHSLESDLLALKLIHSSVVDTAIVFPHRLGLPYKRALKNLMADHLKRIIQDNVDGHDSSEDASACMELMIWKIKEDAKVKR